MYVMYICMYMYVCIYVCVYVCMYVYMYVNVCMYVCMYVYMLIMYVCHPYALICCIYSPHFAAVLSHTACRPSN